MLVVSRLFQGQSLVYRSSWWKKSCTSWYGGFLKWWYPTTMGFPTKNDHFGVFWGYHYFRKHPKENLPSFTRFQLNHPRWLFGISSINSRSTTPGIKKKVTWNTRVGRWVFFLGKPLGRCYVSFSECNNYIFLRISVIKWSHSFIHNTYEVYKLAEHINEIPLVIHVPVSILFICFVLPKVPWKEDIWNSHGRRMIFACDCNRVKPGEAGEISPVLWVLWNITGGGHESKCSSRWVVDMEKCRKQEWNLD